MIEPVSYCILGGCLLWTLGLMFYLCVESANDAAELEKLCHEHAKKGMVKKLAINELKE